MIPTKKKAREYTVVDIFAPGHFNSFVILNLFSKKLKTLRHIKATTVIYKPSHQNIVSEIVKTKQK